MLRKFVVIVLLLASHALLAQETARIINEDFAQGIIIELEANVLSPSSNFLAISDSGKHQLALSNLALGNQNVWIKNSEEDAEINNTAHWYFDDEAEILFLDLKGIRSMLTSQSVLRLTILPLKTFEHHLSLSVFETSIDSGNLPDELKKINDLQLNLK